MNKTRPLCILCILTAIGLLLLPWIILCYAPPEATLHNSYRIFFIHLPLAWWGLFSLFTVFISSIIFLTNNSTRLDQWAEAATETGVLFCILALATGMVWAKLAWGVWWRWEPKLFTTLLLCLMYLGCIVIRKSTPNLKRNKLLAAVVAIVAFINVPFIFLSARWLQSAHPPPLVLKGDLASEMLPPLIPALIIIGALWLSLTLLRYKKRRIKLT